MSTRQCRYGVLIAIGLGFIIAAVSVTARPWILYNPSDSAPQGFYILSTMARPETGDLVAAWLPREAQSLAVDRGYLRDGIPVIKTVWAVAGDRVCVENRQLTAPFQPPLIALKTDRAGRSMPHWNDCRVLRSGELFLASNDVLHSFDGRYFGPVPVENVLGRVTLFWPRNGREEPSGEDRTGRGGEGWGRAR